MAARVYTLHVVIHENVLNTNIPVDVHDGTAVDICVKKMSRQNTWKNKEPFLPLTMCSHFRPWSSLKLNRLGKYMKWKAETLSMPAFESHSMKAAPCCQRAKKAGTTAWLCRFSRPRVSGWAWTCDLISQVITLPSSPIHSSALSCHLMRNLEEEIYFQISAALQKVGWLWKQRLRRPLRSSCVWKTISGLISE